ncbi:MAG: amidohydrolase family protein [Acidobacteriota bacterium]
MRTNGRNVSTNEWVQLEADTQLRSIDSILDPNALAQAQESNLWIAPGFIDLQINGFAGVDYNSPSAAHQEIALSIQAIFSTGVTRFLPTVITGSPEDMLGALRNLHQTRQRGGIFLAMEGFHVEGPHISPEDGPRGAHPKHCVRPPNFSEFQRWQEATDGNVKLITVAPEWPEAPRYIEQVVQAGSIVSIGHTRASSAQIQAAVSAGATLSTHLGNGADQMLPRHPNYIWEQLAEDRLSASFIVDGLHLPDTFLKVALRAKTVQRSLLVTDAVAPAMCEPGNYMLGEVEVELKPDNRVVLRGGSRLAGSSLRMDAAISNVMRIGNLSLLEAVSMATSNPARLARIGGRQRSFSPGDRADLVRFAVDKNRLKVIETYLAGEMVYQVREM